MQGFTRNISPTVFALVTSASYAATASLTISASWAPSTPSDTAISASWASASLSASYVKTSSWAINVVNGGTTLSTGSTYPITASVAVISQTADAISFVPYAAVSASWVSASVKITTSDTASYVLSSNISGLITNAASASWVSASAFITTAQTASYVSGANVIGAVSSASYANTASWAINAINGGTTLSTGSIYPITASWAVSASWAPSLPATSATSASWASSSLSSSYALTASFVPSKLTGRVIGLCTAYTPLTNDPDVSEVPMPYDSDGITSISWSVNRLNFRVNMTGSNITVVRFEKSTGGGIFSGTEIGTITLPATTYETFTSSLNPIIISGDKMRFNVLDRGTSGNWTLTAEMSPI